MVEELDFISFEDDEGAVSSPEDETVTIRFSLGEKLEVVRTRRLNAGDPNYGVYRAVGESDDEPYVVHEWRLDGGADVDGIVKEFEGLSRITHENLVAYVSMHHERTADGSRVVYLLQERVEGLSFAQMLADMTPRIKFLRTIAEEVLTALLYLHKQKIIHGAVSESCIYYDSHGQVRISNFGLHGKLMDLCRRRESKRDLSFKDDIEKFGLFLISVHEGERVAKPTDIGHVDVPQLSEFLQACFDPKIKSCNMLLRHTFFKASTRLTASRMTKEFKELDELGKGGYGKVVKVRHLVDKKEYAVKKMKIMSRNEEANGLVINEVLLLARLDHKCLVRYFNAWRETSRGDDDSPCESDSEYSDSEDEATGGGKLDYFFIQMELCANSLKGAMQNNELNDRTIWRYLKEILMGLNYIHSKHILHRDIKPENILINSNGKIKIGDFGLSKSLYMKKMAALRSSGDAEAVDLNRLTSKVGTAPYAAPEMRTGLYDCKVDMYSLGVTFCEMNYRPVTRFELQEACKQIRDERSFPTTYDRQRENHVISQLLQRDPALRPNAQVLLGHALNMNQQCKKEAKTPRKRATRLP